MQEITVRVPASTSNLGPGFDCLGVALRIYNDVTVARRASRQHLHPRIVSDAADRFFKQSRRRAFPFSYSVTENIPRSRGLGSSATIRLGVLLALNRLSGNALDRFTIFRLCAELEGHPDNAAPATFGGFTVVQSSATASVPQGQRDASTASFQILRFEPREREMFCLQKFPIPGQSRIVRTRAHLRRRSSRRIIKNCAAFLPIIFTSHFARN